MVSDGISANNQYIAATVDIDVNDATELVAEADLPAGVMEPLKATRLKCR